MVSVECLVADLESAADKLATEDLGALTDTEIESLLGDLHRVEAKLRSNVVAAVGEVETRGLHLLRGQRSVGGYLAHRLRARQGAASATASLAHKAAHLPHTLDALAAGLISESHAQLICGAYRRKVADVFARDEAVLVEKAQELSFQQFYWFIRH